MSADELELPSFSSMLHKSRSCPVKHKDINQRTSLFSRRNSLKAMDKKPRQRRFRGSVEQSGKHFPNFFELQMRFFYFVWFLFKRTLSLWSQLREKLFRKNASTVFEDHSIWKDAPVFGLCPASPLNKAHADLRTAISNQPPLHASAIGSKEFLCDQYFLLEVQSLSVDAESGVDYGFEDGRFDRTFTPTLDADSSQRSGRRAMQIFESKSYSIWRIWLDEATSPSFRKSKLFAHLALLTSASHPNIVRYITFWGERAFKESVNDDFDVIGEVESNEKACVYVQMEHFTESSLTTWLSWNDSSESEVFFIFSQILQGLVHLHTQGIAHGNLSLDTVLVCVDGVKLCDFGLGVKARGHGWELTAADVERGLESQTSSFSSDLIALGALLRSLLARRDSFALSSAEAETLARLLCAETPAVLSAACIPASAAYLRWRDRVFDSLRAD